MFNVGELVIGNNEARRRYGITNDKALMVVTDNDYDTYRGLHRIVVKIVGHAEYPHDIGYTDKVYEKMFMPITIEDYKTLYPNAEINMTLVPERYRNPAPPTLMVTNANPIPDEELKAMVPSIVEFLKDYRYHATETGVFAMLKEWGKNNAWIVELFKNHPNYNGKYQIAFDEDYPREINGDVISSFYDWMYEAACKLRKPKRYGCFTYREAVSLYNNIYEVVRYMCKLYDYTYIKKSEILVKGKTVDEWIKERNHYSTLANKMKLSMTSNEIYSDGEIYEKEGETNFRNFKKFAEIIYYNRETFASKEFADKVNKLFPNAKAVEKQKVSRIVNKVCKLTGIDKLEDYNKEFAKYADAINPLMIKRHTVISCHPVDYLTMSFGNSWISCHSIDKYNVRNVPQTSGCQYSVGTLSYMLDNSSFVYYTVDKDYNGNELELQPKINRCMFHMGEDKLIQARVYPSSSDYDSNIYKVVREIVQKVVADCMSVPNLWKNVKGTSECGSVIASIGRHYRDYLNVSNSNVSYLKREENDGKNLNLITVGHDAICVGCGTTYTNTSSRIECDDCWNQLIKCEHCGRKHRASDMHMIDGKYYCCSCSFYCKAHERYEVGSIYGHITWWGDFCKDALDEELVIKCNYCGNYKSAKNSSFITASDGKHFCESWCALQDEYRFVRGDDTWYPLSEVKHCEVCDKWVLKDNFNEESNCCTDCYVTIDAEDIDEELIEEDDWYDLLTEEAS